MTHAHRRKTSGNPWFRMDVPKDIRHLAGKTSWQHSLGATDQTTADARRASYTAHYKKEIVRLRTLLAEGLTKNADHLVEKAFAKLTSSYGSIDQVIAAELESIALTVRSSWSADDARIVEEEVLGEALDGEWESSNLPITLFDSDEEKRRFNLRAQLLETRQTGGLVYQELARALLAKGLYDPLSYQLGCLFYASDDIDITSPPAFYAVARAYLKRLAEHRFTSWPEGVREALAPIVTPVAVVEAGAPPVSNGVIPAIQGPHTLRAAFELWKRRKGIVGEHKTADEFATALARFEELTGVTRVSDVTSSSIKSFKSQVAQLPSRPKKVVASLPLIKQIELAHKESLITLSPPTVGKHIAGIRVMLAEAVDAGWITSNPASGITVDGAKWEGTERDHFSDDDMHLIYTSRLMTDPDACSDTMFWILFLAPFHGSRPGEHCKLKTTEIVRDGGEWLMRIRADRRKRRADIDAPVTRPRRQKTKSSIRDVPIHWILAEGGFLDFVEIQKSVESEWLFEDLVADKYGDRYKYLSREINQALRKLGISDPDKSFYSTRHTMKREGRRRRIAAQNLDQLAGHAAANTGAKYGQGVPADVLKDDIDSLEFRSVPWDAVAQCGRVRVERLARRHGLVG